MYSTSKLFDFRPTSWTAAQSAAHWGMASDKKGLCVESVAQNRLFNPKYLSPSLSNTSIYRREPYQERCGMDLDPWNVPAFQEACQRHNIPVMEVSRDAGGFYCNHLMYQMRRAQLRHKLLAKTPFIFLHIPCSSEAVRDPTAFAAAGKIMMRVEDIIVGLRLLLKSAKLQSNPTNH